MKFAIVILAVLGAAFANPVPEEDVIDWSKIKSKNIYVEPLRALPAPKIVGGSEAAAHSRPYQVALIFDGSWFCGGSLITRNYVLTAAHCTDGARQVQVILGAHNKDTSESTQVKVTSTNMITHSSWNSNTLRNDIALIKLPSAVSLTNAIQPVTLATGSNTYAGSTSIVSGWGKTSDSAVSTASRLMQVSVPVLANSACSSVFGSSITSSHVCTNGSGGKGSCNGDSGGPLTVNGAQIGIVSFGTNQCQAGYPSAYTRVTEFISWIRANSDY